MQNAPPYILTEGNLSTNCQKVSLVSQLFKKTTKNYLAQILRREKRAINLKVDDYVLEGAFTGWSAGKWASFRWTAACIL